MRVTHAINNIYKLISFLKLILVLRRHILIQHWRRKSLTKFGAEWSR